MPSVSLACKVYPIIRLIPLLTLLACCTGCPVTESLPAPGRVIIDREPDSGHKYHLYVPTRYNDKRQWPMVITCHGTPPWDTAEAQFEEWKGFAEQKGFLLVAPELVGTRGDFTPQAPQQIQKQAEDEEAILGIVRTIQASHAVDDKLIFLTGWSAGGYAVLYTGLRHPDVFRALSVRQGNFDKAFVEPCIPFLDRHQPIQIMYGSEDLLKDQALACTTWLRSHDIDPTILERPGFHRRDPRPVFDFFIEIARNRPWIRISIGDDPNDPMRVTLSVRSSFEAVRYLWDFGDETERSPLSKPVHRYEKPGLYNVQLALWPDQGNPRVRQIQIQIPRARLSSNNPTIPSTQ